MRRALGTVVVGIASILGGCGAGAQDQVRAKVQQLVSAAAAGDYATICKQVLAPSLVGQLQASGSSCEYVVQLALGAGQTRTLSIGKINMHGNTAQAITLEDTKGQQASVNAIGLVRTSQGWRISSLNAPVASS